MSPYRESARPPATTLVRLGRWRRELSLDALAIAVGAAWGVTVAACATLEPDLSRALTAGLRLASEAEPKLVRAYELEQLECLRLPEERVDPCLQRVRSEWKDLREAYDETWRAVCALEKDLCPEDRR